MHGQFPEEDSVQDTQRCNLDVFVIGVTCFSGKQNYRPLFPKMNIPVEKGDR
jgi:hypothetical protein